MAYPQCEPTQVDATAEIGMAILQDVIVSVRNIRAELKVELKKKLAIEVFADSDVRSLVEQNRGALQRLANVEGLTFVESSLAKAAGARSTARFDVRVLYERKIDVAVERDRLNKELTKLTQELSRATGQLNNEAFLAKAPALVVEGLKKRKSEVEILVQKTNDALGELGAIG
jgi:valyl-tRNA synthetase